MSIYGSLPGISDDDECGPPWLYQGSHILPADDDPRGGSVGLAEIPGHITRDGRDHAPDDWRPWPWLRLSVDTQPGDPAVILNPAQVRYLAEQLTAWADQTEGTQP